MFKRFSLLAVIVLAGLVLAGCAPPPPLRSDKYLKDQSVLTDQPCAAPCFDGIEIGKMTFVDAVAKVKANSAYANVQTQDADASQNRGAVAVWASASGEACCQITSDPKTGLVQSIVLKLSPDIKIAQLIEKYGEPVYSFSNDYTQEEAVIQIFYPEKQIIALVVPGDANSTLDESDPVVAVIYLDKTVYDDLVKANALQGWAGYASYKAYKDSTPIITPVPTNTPAQ